jgi:hypothetical protein
MTCQGNKNVAAGGPPGRGEGQPGGPPGATLLLPWHVMRAPLSFVHVFGDMPKLHTLHKLRNVL